MMSRIGHRLVCRSFASALALASKMKACRVSLKALKSLYRGSGLMVCGIAKSCGGSSMAVCSLSQTFFCSELDL